jgi:hypothetical protein
MSLLQKPVVRIEQCGRSLLFSRGFVQLGVAKVKLPQRRQDTAAISSDHFSCSSHTSPAHSPGRSVSLVSITRSVSTPGWVLAEFAIFQKFVLPQTLWSAGYKWFLFVN